MLRSSAKNLSRNLASQVMSSKGGHRVPTPIGSRASSTSSSSKGSKGGILFGTAVIGVTAVGSTLAYAKFDADFRKYVEESVPGASGVLNAVLGEPEVTKPAKPGKIPATSTPPSKKRPLPDPLLRKEAPEVKMEVKEEISPPKVSQASQPVLSEVPSPPIEKPSFMEERKTEDVVEVNKTEEVQEPSKEGVETPLAKKLEEGKPEEESVTTTENEVMDEMVLSANDIMDLHETAEDVNFEKNLHKKVAAIKEELEAQMVTQLKRQAEAHADHISDALEVQKKELSRRFIRELDQSLEQAKLTHQNDLSSLLGHVRGLESALQNRSEMDHVSLQAQELWLACSALLSALVSNSTSTSEVRKLEKEIKAVKSATNMIKDDFVHAVINSIPDSVSTRGVYTEDVMKQRFLKVEKMAKRTALIEEEGGSLLKYFLSYLQSKLMLQPSTDELPSKYEPIDLGSLNTFDIVWLARGSLERGDLDQAVRYMTLLSGQPKNVSSDWIKEARLLLQTRQACLALMAHAAAVSVEALPQRN